MTAHISPDDLTILDAEPRIHDLKLAEALGYEKVHNIRQLIERNLRELEGHGGIFCAAQKNDPDTPRGRGRPGMEYWLNEPQALLVTMFARTERAAAVRREIIDVFIAWRRGLLPPTPPQAPQLPPPAPGGETAPRPPLIPSPPLAPAFEDWARSAGVPDLLRYCSEVRLTAGKSAALAAMQGLGLPTFAPAARSIAGAPEISEAKELLSLLLDTDLAYGETVRELLVRALDDDADSAATLLKEGVKVLQDPGREGFIIGNPSSPARRFFADYPRWEQMYPLCLRRLPGADGNKQSNRFKCGALQHRGTFIPARYLDPAALV